MYKTSAAAAVAIAAYCTIALSIPKHRTLSSSYHQSEHCLPLVNCEHCMVFAHHSEPRPYLDAGGRTAMLRPSTARLLLHLAKLQPGQHLLDPMAGIGTIPIEVRV
jgi:Putative RNA methylase family UPF0020